MTKVEKQEAYLHSGVNAAASDQRKMRVHLNDVYDAAVAFVDAAQCASALAPHEPVAVVRARDHILILRPKEVD